MIIRTYLVTVTPKFISWNCNRYTTPVNAASRSEAIKIVRREYNDYSALTKTGLLPTQLVSKKSDPSVQGMTCPVQCDPHSG